MRTLNDLLFDVQLIDNSENTNQEYSKKVVATIDGVEKVLNYCSPRFNLLKNEDVFPVIEKYLEDAKCNFTKAYGMNANMTIFNAKYIIHDVNGIDAGLTVGAKKGDKIFPIVSIGNSYNGMKQSLFTFGYFRLVCTNGLVVPYEGSEEKNFTIKGKHTEKLNISFAELIQKLRGFISMQETFKKRFEILCDRAVENYGDRVLEVLNATKVSASKDQMEFILGTITKETKDLGLAKPNEWLVYNAINAHIYKGTTKSGKTKVATPDKLREVDSRVLSWIMADVTK